jgi:predicted amidohydrolase
VPNGRRHGGGGVSAVRIDCRQLAPVVGDLDGNRRLAREAVRAAVAGGARVVVLPELCTSGYVFESPAEARALAQPAHGGALAEWAAEAARGDAVVIGGFAELGEDGEVYNSAAVVDGSGVRAVYRKTHLWDREKLVFRPGDAAPPVVDTALGRIGVVVCYDTSFPELLRDVALRGADVVAVPTNNPVFPRPDGQIPQEIVAMRAHALFNRVFVASCDRCGTERGVEFLGGSVIADEQGWSRTALGLGAPGSFSADCMLERSRDKRWGERNDVFADRRPELYGAVTEAATAVAVDTGADRTI